MLEAWFLMLLFATVVLLWSQARASAERAQVLAEAACEEARVQLLDQTVSLERIGLRRDAQGRLRLWRRYRYEYSRGGDDRQRAGLALLGSQLLWLQAPEAATPTQVNGRYPPSLLSG